jgi:hypothetical protein
MMATVVGGALIGHGGASGRGTDGAAAPSETTVALGAGAGEIGDGVGGGDSAGTGATGGAGGATSSGTTANRVDTKGGGGATTCVAKACGTDGVGGGGGGGNPGDGELTIGTPNAGVTCVGASWYAEDNSGAGAFSHAGRDGAAGSGRSGFGGTGTEITAPSS